MSLSTAAQLIMEIEHDLIELRKEYTMFLNDISNLEPIEPRGKLEKKLKRLRNMNFNKTEDQFRANNATAKVNSMFQLWDRQVERKHRVDPKSRRKKAAPPPPPPKSNSVVIRDAASQREQVETLYDQYMKLNLSLGSKKVINFSKFQSFIENQTNKVKAKKKIDQVKYEVTVQDDKVVIKTKTAKK